MSLRAAALFVCLSLGLLLLASDLPSVAFRRAQHAWGARRRLASKDLNLTNTLNKTRESPWQEDYVPNVTWGYEMEMDTRSSGMVRYRGCRHCAEEAFCKYASNPGCGGSAVGGVTTFRNIRHAHGCAVKPVLSIPRSYVRDLDVPDLSIAFLNLGVHCAAQVLQGLSGEFWASSGQVADQDLVMESPDDLRSKPGAYLTLKAMLHSGFDVYRGSGHHGPVQQCIHYPWAVSVRWLHLHSFCTGARFEGMPGGSSLCATMHSHDDASRIATRWSR
ncbi:unnamed protein product [Effrenium voratum]|uniref:Uncharacterized protein n=1 Tax=Effrenium voratum TaxID=2562239 RepID=A0AA36I8I6_9DINO|nr:unnamed protein product [Effrenium voratum]